MIQRSQSIKCRICIFSKYGYYILITCQKVRIRLSKQRVFRLIFFCNIIFCRSVLSMYIDIYIGCAFFWLLCFVYLDSFEVCRLLQTVLCRLIDSFVIDYIQFFSENVISFLILHLMWIRINEVVFLRFFRCLRRNKIARYHNGDCKNPCEQSFDHSSCHKPFPSFSHNIIRILPSIIISFFTHLRCTFFVFFIYFHHIYFLFYQSFCHFTVFLNSFALLFPPLQNGIAKDTINAFVYAVSIYIFFYFDSSSFLRKISYTSGISLSST